jgi:hypothetical protein
LVNYIHDLPGRLRVRSATIKRNPREAQRIHAAVSAMEGVSAVEVNLRTGSLTVAYAIEETSSLRLLGALDGMGYTLPVTSPRPSEALARVGERVVKVAVRVTIDALIERSAIALVRALI